MKRIAFLPNSFKDFKCWATEDKHIYQKIVAILGEMEREPLKGVGEPESLKHELKGLWSRRITDEHRLVYKVDKEEIVIVSCRFHYV
ncbi:toxin YoeB [Candidatus Thiomargarita nelsonii]|uniref:Putative mRNA interferase YoeB n=1 Tax=Candidatus Thiomargarita nelsonii TaxID=1003181 RepID=A0A4E0QM53_9GAMM|nr:toxin YoeB [Candidatus Thiomargarita nelsonii]